MTAPARPSLLAIALNSATLIGITAVRNAGQRAISMLAGYAVVASLFAVSLFFLTFSAFSAIAATLGTIYAALIAGCTYLLIGLIALLVLQANHR